MSKLNALVKVAVNARILGTAFGGAIGALPGLLELHKLKGAPAKEKSRIIGKILIGAGVGGTLGNVGGLLLTKELSFKGKNPFETFNRKDFLPGNTALGTILGAAPGAIEMTGIFNKGDSPEQKKKHFNNGLKKSILGAGIGASIFTINNLLNRTSRGI